MTDTMTVTRPTLSLPGGRKGVPFTEHLREFVMPDGRKVIVDRRTIAFLCEAKPGEFPKPVVTILAFKVAGARPVPVTTAYAELKDWWRGAGVKVAGEST
jgi:hypothetical protein